MRTAAIIQARMGSTRLPGKVLAPVLGKPLLAYMIERLRRCAFLEDVIVATCEPSGKIRSVAEECEAKTWVGEEDDVLSRVLGAAEAHGAKLIVSLTADCPLIDPMVVERVIRAWDPYRWHFATSSPTYVPAELAYPRGMDVQVLSAQTLAEVSGLVTDPVDREHVTHYLPTHPERFRTRLVEAPSEFQSRARLTVDTEEDLRLIRAIIETLYPADPNFGLRDMLDLLAARPELREINRHVAQKPVRTT